MKIASKVAEATGFKLMLVIGRRASQEASYRSHASSHGKQGKINPIKSSRNYLQSLSDFRS